MGRALLATALMFLLAQSSADRGMFDQLTDRCVSLRGYCGFHIPCASYEDTRYEICPSSAPCCVPR